MKRKTYIYLLALVPFLIVAMLYEIVPLITVILKSFQSDGEQALRSKTIRLCFQNYFIKKQFLTV